MLVELFVQTGLKLHFWILEEGGRAGSKKGHGGHSTVGEYGAGLAFDVEERKFFLSCVLLEILVKHHTADKL